MAKRRKRQQAGGEVRIIGGAWRRRRIRFPGDASIRPTPDRLRETLFNWLGPRLEGSRVLDLFAGSGALGIEALSRGAAEAVFVERNRRSARALQANLAALNVADAQVAGSDVFTWLKTRRAGFDLVFLDPPYGLDRASEVLTLLRQGGYLRAGHRVYLEQPSDRSLALPSDWQLVRESRAGDAMGRLIGLRRV